MKLYDNNDERQRKVAEACAIIVREKNPEIKFSYTTNPEEAFTAKNLLKC
ncbi:family 4 glycosyl hydrolase [Clostridioides difficile]